MLTSIHFNIHIWLVAIPKENNNNNNKNRFPQWLGHEECTCKCKRQRGHTFDFRARMIPWRRKGQHIPVFFLDIPWMQEPGGTQSTISKKNQTWLNTSNISRKEYFSPILFSRSVMSDSLQPHASQHASPPYPLPTPGVYPTHVHQVGDVIQPSHPLSSPFPPAPNPSQHQGLLQWVKSSHKVANVLEFQLQHQSFQWIPRTDLL